MSKRSQATCDCGECPKCLHRVYMRGWYWRNRDRALEQARQSRLRHIEKIREYDRKRGFRVYDPEKVRVRNVVTHAIEHGRLTRLPCEVCGDEKTDAHHEDYAKPLEVRWLCRRHHGEAHRSELAA